MLRATAYLLLVSSAVFNLLSLFTFGANPPCEYSQQNLSLAYLDCFSLTNVTNLTLNLKHGTFPKLEVSLRDTFESYCSQIPAINNCVSNRLAPSNSCDHGLNDAYLRMESKSNDFCDEDAGLKNTLLNLLRVSRPLDTVTINRCKPSTFDFHLCHRFAEKTRDEERSAATAEKPYDETDYLMEINLCIYSSVFVGCPADAAILTILYEIDAWIPPHLGANTTEVLIALSRRAGSYH